MLLLPVLLLAISLASLTVGQSAPAPRFCLIRPEWVIDKAASCAGANAYVREGVGLILTCPTGANATHGLSLTSSSPFFTGGQIGRAAIASFTAPPGAPLGAQPYVAFRAATPTGISMEGRLQHGAKRHVRASFAKLDNASFWREDSRDIQPDDVQLNVSLARGEVAGSPALARVDISTRTESLRLDKQTWSLEQFSVSLHLGVDGGAVFSEVSAVVLLFADADGGGNLAGTFGCAYGTGTAPPTPPPTPAPTPAATVPLSTCTPGEPGCCPQAMTCEQPTLTCADGEVLTATATVCNCETNFKCLVAVKTTNAAAACAAATPLALLLLAAFM